MKEEKSKTIPYDSSGAERDELANKEEANIEETMIYSTEADAEVWESEKKYSKVFTAKTKKIITTV